MQEAHIVEAPESEERTRHYTVSERTFIKRQLAWMRQATRKANALVKLRAKLDQTQIEWEQAEQAVREGDRRPSYMR